MAKRGLVVLWFVCLVLLISIISAQNISVDYDSEVFVGQAFSFKINISNFEEDLYDVKIEITANGARVARILNNEQWKSTFYYVIDAISPGQEEEFFLNITEYIGTADILVRLRDPSGSSVSFEGYEITSVEQEIPQENITNQTNLTDNNQTGEPPDEEDENGEENETLLNQTNTIFNNNTEEPPEENQTPPAPVGVLRLNPKVIKSDDVTKNLEKSDYAVYGFIVFCVLLAFLFILKKVKSPKNEFEF